MKKVSRPHITFYLDGQAVTVVAGTTIAAAIMMQTSSYSRLSVTGQARSPFCGMGVCHECKVQVHSHTRLACQTLCEANAQVFTQTQSGGNK